MSARSTVGILREQLPHHRTDYNGRTRQNDVAHRVEHRAVTSVDNPPEVWAEPGANPARWSDAVIEQLAVLLDNYVPVGHVVFDPFAGEGTKLAVLCEQSGRPFAGNDLVAWRDQHPSVGIADSTLPESYPAVPFTVATSPTYNNGVNDGFIPRDASRRMTYTVAAGRRLDPTNTGRYSGRSGPGAERQYWELHRACVAHWPELALVNVKDSIRDHDVYPCVALWKALLEEAGYSIVEQVYAVTPGLRFGANHDARTFDECIIVARRS